MGDTGEENQREEGLGWGGRREYATSMMILHDPTRDDKDAFQISSATVNELYQYWAWGCITYISTIGRGVGSFSSSSSLVRRKKWRLSFFGRVFFFIFFFYIIDIALEFLFLLALFFLKGSWLDDGQGVRVTSPAGAYRVIVMMDDGKGSLGWIGLGWVGLGHVEMRYLDVYG